MQFKYYIQELRGLAIVFVTLYHFNIVFKGGFIGVDVFFVISGYLISAIIMNDLHKNKFSFLLFYSRRFKRIIPSSFFVLLFIYLKNMQNENTYESLNIALDILYSSIFCSNYWFRRNMFNYFNSINNSPVLHFWSLSTEEQFYFILPISLYIIYLSSCNILLVYSLIFIYSFANNLYYSYSDKSSYFHFPSRIWEMVSGCIISIENKSIFRLKNENLYLNISYFTLILVAILYNKNITYPGLYSCMPVFLTILIIMINNCDDKYHSKTIIIIGKFSYVIYLIHYPFLKYCKVKNNYIIICIILLLSYLLHISVEYPFHRLILKDSILFPLLYSILSILLLLNICTKRIKHLRGKMYNDKTLFSLHRLLLFKTCTYCTTKDNYCEKNGNCILFIGDSHVRQFIFSLEDIFIQNSIMPVNVYITYEDILDRTWIYILHSIKISNYLIIIVAFFYYQHISDLNDFNKQFLSLIEFLVNNKQMIFIFNDNPSFTLSPIKYFLSNKDDTIDNKYCIKAQPYPKYKGKNKYLINSISLDKNFYFNNRCKIFEKNIFMYSDTNHLSIPYLKSISYPIYSVIKKYIHINGSINHYKINRNCSYYVLDEKKFDKVMKCKTRKDY